MENEMMSRDIIKMFSFPTNAELCEQFRSKSDNCNVIVPSSVDKDGSFVAHQLTYKYGMQLFVS